MVIQIEKNNANLFNREFKVRILNEKNIQINWD